MMWYFRRRVRMAVVEGMRLSVSRRGGCRIVGSLTSRPTPGGRETTLALNYAMHRVGHVLGNCGRRNGTCFVRNGEKHGPTGAVPGRAHGLIISLCHGGCCSTGFIRFARLLKGRRSVRVSPSTIVSVLRTRCVLSPGTAGTGGGEVGRRLGTSGGTTGSRGRTSRVRVGLITLRSTRSHHPETTCFNRLRRVSTAPCR